MSVQDLARCISAVGSVKLPEDEGEGVYVLSVRDGHLVEKLWVGDTVKSESVIDAEVNENTSASYILGNEEGTRLVIFIDKNNSLQCYSFNDEFEEWRETPLGSKWNVTTSPKSKLSANVGAKGEVIIAYQDEAGKLVGITHALEEGWKSFDPLGDDPVLGTPQNIEVIDDKVHLFYIGKDGVRFSTFDPSTGAWEAASVLENTAFDTSVDNFNVFKSPETGSFHSYFYTDGALWNVEGEKKTLLGKVAEDGKLVPSDKAQAGWYAQWYGARKVVINSYGATIYY